MTGKIARIALGLVFAAGLLASCGGGSESGDSPSTTPAPTTTAPPATTAPTTATTLTTTTAGVTTTAGPSDSELIAAGKVLYDETASGIGCAYCHGLDGAGILEQASPDIRGQGTDDILLALSDRAEMTSLVLSYEEVEAIAAYIATLP
ncbi:MAG: c-type cytochrome [Acidimicrobiia bacterium]